MRLMDYYISLATGVSERVHIAASLAAEQDPPELLAEDPVGEALRLAGMMRHARQGSRAELGEMIARALLWLEMEECLANKSPARLSSFLFEGEKKCDAESS